MRKHVWFGVMLLLCCLFCCFGAAAEKTAVTRRALLVGCDDFIMHSDTAPSAAMNVGRVARMLQTDARGYESITQLSGTVGTQEALFSAIGSAFATADADDVSLLYICTHGLYDRITFRPSLVLSDGATEETVTASALRAALDNVPGTKVLIFDFCNSGAFIGKGAWDTLLRNAFTGPDYQVLTSAGARENSFLWIDRGHLGGGSYFAAELCDGLRARAFDLNADGVITLSETRQGLLENHGASSAQCYPEASDFALYVYDQTRDDAGESPIRDVYLDNAVLTYGDDTLYFSYTVSRPVRVQYQLVYYRNGEWRFDSPQIVDDIENAQGALAPGRKERSLTLLTEDEEPYGYVLLQIVAQEGRRAMMAGSQLICVQPMLGDPMLHAWGPTSFKPESGEELGVYVHYDFPCSVSVTVRDETGTAVRRLAYKVPSRPLGIHQNGSIFYWDGLDNMGHVLPAGEYNIEVSSTVGDEKYTVYYGPVQLQR